jgi:hypothetical protein
MQKKVLLILILLCLFPLPVLSGKSEKGTGAKRSSVKAASLWQTPNNIASRNLFYGPGGQAGQPRPPFRFIEEDRDGSSPKFVVEDARGIRWKTKLAEEAKPETAATRLLWAVGYFTDVNYYLPRMRVVGLRKLSRGQKYVTADGVVQGARLERIIKKKDDWSWFDNPFVGTRAFNGLRVMMALLNKWDLKQVNNAIYQIEAGELRYFVSDLGDTFGKTGGDWTRSKGKVSDYAESDFVDKVNPQSVDLVLHSRPPLLYAVAVPYYVKRTRMGRVAEDIPRNHARWIGEWLGRLSDRQIKDAFRAANYAPNEVNLYAAKVRERIRQLNDL